MENFTIEGFANACKAAMANADDRHAAAAACLQQTLDANDPQYIVDTLEAAIPAGAGVGEMIVHSSPDLTMMYVRVPARFQSGIHNHTVFACIGQLFGKEKNVIYDRASDGKGLTVARSTVVNAGEVISLPHDVIHHIENPNTSTSGALHIYGGDFYAIMDERCLWDYDDHSEKAFNFEGLIIESIKGMKNNNNQTGLTELMNAIPAARQLIEG
jgi:predicted metal-dependent enzyme (double-stranded beta helix superfamily)